MIPLYTNTEFQSATSRQSLPLKCKKCGKEFFISKNLIQLAISGHHSQYNFCSRPCATSQLKTKTKVCCTTCGKFFEKFPNQIKRSKNHFCNHSCATKYQNAHKTHGTRRSKFEAWLEQQLKELHPSLEIHFNRKDTINSELDVYIPSLKLAFELNGIFHYEPIYGSEKLSSIQTNDHRKMLACAEQGIELCVLDISGISYFKPTKAHKFLNIITSIINDKLHRLS